jgi:hypothetical protein
MSGIENKETNAQNKLGFRISLMTANLSML